ncbi:MAG TPA: hypothetical protein VFA45_09505, partial [Actinomycetes bacterium]|nr:hypothetical protein [Actinomycetes bacterium]
MAGGTAVTTACRRSIGDALARTWPAAAAAAALAATPAGPLPRPMGPQATISSVLEATWPPLLADTRGRVGLAAALGPEGGRPATSLERPAAPPRDA